MTESVGNREYLTIDEAAKAIGWNRATVYKYVDELGMKKHKFRLNRRTYLAATDVEQLKQIREKPWLAGEETEQPGQEEHVTSPARGAGSPGQ